LVSLLQTRLPIVVPSGGIINCADSPNVCKTKNTDHVVVIGGWGVDAATGLKYWVGRNSYGTQWGEGAGGGWFRLQRGGFTVCSCEHI
jgi:C1A family cysteine protease